VREEEAELVANTGKVDAGSGRMLPPAGSETSMASRAWAWCAARSRTQFHREENVLVGYSRGDVSVDGRGGMYGFSKMLVVTARWRSD
jgi:hypothetical protein